MKRQLIQHASQAILTLFLVLMPPLAQASDVQSARQAYLAGDYAAALMVLVPAAEAGDAQAQNILGAAYEQGNGVPVDMDKALEWYEKSAAQGFAKAEHNLGLFLIGQADGLIRDNARAAKLFEQAMGQDFGPSFWQRGRMHRDGIAGPVDPEAARKVFERGHALGNGQSGNALAEIYRLGVGVDQDEARARQIYREAGEGGYGVAVGNLALMYENGLGGPVDLEAAHRNYLKAVEMGDGNAAVNLSSFMLNHPGAWQSPPRAWAYCLLGMDLARRDQLEKLKYYCTEIGRTLGEDVRKEGAEIRQGGL